MRIHISLNVCIEIDKLLNLYIYVLLYLVFVVKLDLKWLVTFYFPFGLKWKIQLIKRRFYAMPIRDWSWDPRKNCGIFGAVNENSVWSIFLGYLMVGTGESHDPENALYGSRAYVNLQLSQTLTELMFLGLPQTEPGLL